MKYKFTQDIHKSNGYNLRDAISMSRIISKRAAKRDKNAIHDNRRNGTKIVVHDPLALKSAGLVHDTWQFITF